MTGADPGRPSAAAGEIERVWRELVTAALLGTDRRGPPTLPVGPLADLVDDAVRPDAASRMLAAVGVVAAARRAAFVPLPPAPPLQSPAIDRRPLCSSMSVATWRQVIAEWPVLEDEWMLMVVETGQRLPADAMVEMLQRHRGDPVRRARVMLAGGPVATWLGEHVPELQAQGGRRPSVEAVTSAPELAISPDLGELLTVDAYTFVQRLVAGFEPPEPYGPAHRAVLVNLIARCRPAVLTDAAGALRTLATGLPLQLADLCVLRYRMLDELGIKP